MFRKVMFGNFGDIESRSIAAPIPHTTKPIGYGRSTSEV